MCCHYPHWAFNCDTWNPERESTPAMMALVRKHWIEMIKPQGSWNVPLLSLQDSPRKQSSVSCWPKVVIFNRWKCIGCLSEIQIYLPSLWPHPSTCHGSVCMVHDSGPLSCRFINPGLGELCIPFKEVELSGEGPGLESLSQLTQPGLRTGQAKEKFWQVTDK